MNLDVAQFCCEIFLKKFYFLDDKKEKIIYYNNTDSIVIDKLDNSILNDKITFFYDENINDFVPISDDKICIIYTIRNEKKDKIMLIKSLKNNNSYKIPIIHKFIDNLQVKFFKEKNQLILIDYRALYFWKFNNNIQTFQFFFKIIYRRNFCI